MEVYDLSIPTRFGDSPLSAINTLGRRLGRAAELITDYERELWTVVVATLLLDIGTTVFGIQAGLTELNPFVNHFRPTLGLLGTLVLLKGCAALVGVVVWRTLPAKYRGLAPLGMALPWTLAVTANLLLLVSLYL